MKQVEGVYMEGKVVLLEPAPATDPVKVIVMFPEEEMPRKQGNDHEPFLFSWQQPGATFPKVNLSEDIIAERRGE